jgi:tetratricopeptide (TPR) repeat protein
MRRPRPELWLAIAAASLSGCAGEITILAALVFGTTLGAWILGSERHRRALYEAETLRRAIASGQHRGLEQELRAQLALAAAGEGVSLEREWLARAQLGGLLVAEWRLDEARKVYGSDEETEGMGPHLRALAAFGRHELAVLTGTPDASRLEAIRRDRDECLRHVPARFRKEVAAAWDAVEGLCLVRIGHAREATPMLERGLEALTYNPALVVYRYHLGQAYEHIGERQLAAAQYEQAAAAFPGTRLASEATSRLRALSPGAEAGFFRGMLPEAPEASPTTALAVRGDAAPHEDDDAREPDAREPDASSDPEADAGDDRKRTG